MNLSSLRQIFSLAPIGGEGRGEGASLTLRPEYAGDTPTLNFEPETLNLFP